MWVTAQKSINRKVVISLWFVRKPIVKKKPDIAVSTFVVFDLSDPAYLPFFQKTFFVQPFDEIIKLCMFSNRFLDGFQLMLVKYIFVVCFLFRELLGH